MKRTVPKASKLCAQEEKENRIHSKTAGATRRRERIMAEPQFWGYLDPDDGPDLDPPSRRLNARQARRAKHHQRRSWRYQGLGGIRWMRKTRKHIILTNLFPTFRSIAA